MKTLLFIFALITLTFAGFATTSAYACDGKKCAKCAEMKKGDDKPAAKAKEPCEKTLGEKKKPCAKCDESERNFQAKKRGEIFFNE